MEKVFYSYTSLKLNKNSTRILISFLFLLMSFFDFYKVGFRIFEILAYSLFFLIVVFSPPRFRVSHIYFGFLIFFGLMYSSLGLVYSENQKSAFGALIGIVMFSLLRIRGIVIPQNHLRIVLIIHLLAFFAQFIYYYSFGDVINYHQFTDIEPRLESSIFRPAGFFYEPAIYCLAVYMLSILIDPLCDRFNLLGVLAAISMILSFSILGIASAFVILFRMAFIRRIYLLPLGLALVLLIIAYMNIDNPLIAFVFNRLNGIDSDPSADGRFGGMVSFFQSDNVFRIFFGSGFGSSFEQYGSNAISALLSSVGVFGLIGFLALILFISQNSILLFFLLIPILVAAPIFTYGFFAIWLSQLPHMLSVGANSKVNRTCNSSSTMPAS